MGDTKKGFIVKTNLILICTLCLLLSGCACFSVKYKTADICYCRVGDQKLKVGDISQESEGKVPSGLGAIIELLLGE
jgi:hypothetical protein